MQSIHSGKLERWFGTETVENLSANMRGWYGPPIACASVPGAVYITGDGDFIGKLKCGDHSSLLEYQFEQYKNWLWKLYTASKTTLHMAGFASLSDLISEATTAAKRQEVIFFKSGNTGVVGATNTLWRSGGQPASGVSPPGAPGGQVCGSGTTGALAFTAPAGGDTLHIVSVNSLCSVGTNSLLLYDRLFNVDKVMSSSATEAVTGVPTRYQNTTVNTVDSVEGNFLFVECSTTLSNTAHNWTVCTYVNHLGASGATLPSLAGNNTNIAHRLDQASANWFAPLATGDRGIKNLTQMQCSSAALTGSIQFVIGHPLSFITLPLANTLSIMDGVNGTSALTRVFDNACLAFLEPNKGATTATSYNGSVVCVAG